jgi:hypothetical protein
LVPELENFGSGRVFMKPYQNSKKYCEVPEDLMDSLLRRLQAIMDGQGNHTKYSVTARGAVHTMDPF